MNGYFENMATENTNTEITAPEDDNTDILHDDETTSSEISDDDGGEYGEEEDSKASDSEETAEDEDIEEEAAEDEDIEDVAAEDEDFEEEAADDEDFEEEAADDEDFEEEAAEDEDFEEEAAENEDIEEEAAGDEDFEEESAEDFEEETAKDEDFEDDAVEEDGNDEEELYYDDDYSDAYYYKSRASVQGVIIKMLCAVLILVLLITAVAGIYINSKLNLINYRSSDDEWHPVSYADAEDDLEFDIDYEEDQPSASDIYEDFDDSLIELPDEDIYRDKNVINILILGTDERKKEFTEGSRADSIMVLSIDKKKDTLKLVSIERGITVKMPDGHYDIITHAFHYGGPEWVLDCVQRCFNLDVQSYVRVNFNVFRQLVDSVGGVDIKLTKAEANSLNESRRKAGSNELLHEGMNHLDGADALRYCRLRKIDSDWSRIQRQRTTVKAIQKQCRDMSVTELNDMLNTTLPMIQTNLTKAELTSLILYLPSMLKADIEDMTIPVQGTYKTTKYVDFKTNSKILREFFYGSDAEDQ